METYKKIRNFLTDGDNLFKMSIAFFVVMGMLVIYAIFAAITEHKQWNEYVVTHNCKQTGKHMPEEM